MRFVSVNEKIGRHRWTICALIFAATTINYIDRQILALLKPILDSQIGWTNTQYAWVNFCFQGSYALGLLWFGGYVDRAGAKKGYALSIITWSIAAILHAPIILLVGISWQVPQALSWLAADKVTLLVPAAFIAFLGARLLLGVTEGGNFPSAIKATTQWFPRRERAFATSIFNAGTNAGAVFAPAFVPPLAYSIGWQWTFVLAGLAGFVWLAFWIPWYDSPERSQGVSEAEKNYINSDPPDEESGKMGWLQVVRHPQAWSFITSKFLTDPVWWFFLAWLPDFFFKTRGLDIKKSWLHLVTIYAIITILSIFGGWIVGHLIKRGWSVTRARKTGMFTFALCALPILWVKDVGNWPAVLLIALAGSAHQAWSANLFTTVSDMFPKKAVAVLVGIGGMAGSVGSMIFQIYAGRKLDQFAVSGGATAGYAMLFSLCAFAYLTAFAINHLLAPKYEQVQSRKH